MQAMRVFLPALGLLLAASATASHEAPEFCHGLDCPHYKVTDSTDLYEKRDYKKAAWVSTRVESLLMETALTAGFKRLYGYISGENEAHRVINMTAPVRTSIVAGAGPFCKSNFTVSFFVPFEFQLDDAPVPSHPDVYLEVTPRQSVYVVQFGGFAVTPTLTARADNLTATLREAGLGFEEDFYYYSGYDSPFRLTGRHNEVWVVEKADEQPQEQALEGADAQ